MLSCSSSNQAVQLVGDAAVFAHDVDTAIETRAGAERFAERETIVFALRDGAWTAVHEHLSARPSA